MKKFFEITQWNLRLLLEEQLLFTNHDLQHLLLKVVENPPEEKKE